MKADFYEVGSLYNSEGKLPEMEIQEAALFEEMPENLTYTLIQPLLLRKIKAEVNKFEL